MPKYNIYITMGQTVEAKDEEAARKVIMEMPLEKREWQVLRTEVEKADA